LKLKTKDKATGLYNVVIETPKLSRNKYKYDNDTGLFILNQTLPAGENFPYDFGFLPNTRGEDGDPLDILVLMEEPGYQGCIVKARLLGVIEAEQTEKDGQTVRNDRLVAVGDHADIYAEIKEVKKLQKPLLKEIERFFITYNRFNGKKFKPLGYHGPGRAEELIRKGKENYKKEK
jgi:inorganic pyrophosphatase